MLTPTPNHRWFQPTPDRFFVGLLAVQVFLFLSEHYQWFAFNEHKGWTVLIAVAGCRSGINSGRSSAAVGQAATEAVVTAIVYLIVADAAINIIFQQMGI